MNHIPFQVGDILVKRGIFVSKVLRIDRLIFNGTYAEVSENTDINVFDLLNISYWKKKTMSCDEIANLYSFSIPV